MKKRIDEHYFGDKEVEEQYSTASTIFLFIYNGYYLRTYIIRPYLFLRVETIFTQYVNPSDDGYSLAGGQKLLPKKINNFSKCNNTNYRKHSK